MNATPTLEASQIREHVGAQSYERGRRYFRDGSIFDTRRVGDILKARCYGSHGGPYRVSASIADDGIAADCSCPVGTGGRCKHVAALLLTWQANPQAFAAAEEIDASLQRRSKEELIALVKLMLRREPDLEPLLEMPLPGVSEPDAPFDANHFRRLALEAFQSYEPHDWNAPPEIADRLLTITEIGAGYLAQGDARRAAAVYDAIADVFAEQYGEFMDEEGDLAEVAHACITGLGDCLEATDDPGLRELILESLFSLFRADTDKGGYGIADEVPDLLLESTSPEERQAIAEWVREAMPERSSRSRPWAVDVYADLLLELEADTLDDESYLRICRETGRIADLVARLLDLSRVEEAVEAAQRVNDYTRMNLVLLFHERGQEEAAHQLALAYYRKQREPTVIQWLKVSHERRGETSAALGMAHLVYEGGPSLERYAEVRRLAQALGQWDTLRAKLWKPLRGPHYASLRSEIYLDEGDVDAALKELESVPSYGFGPGFGTYRMRMADAIAAVRPRDAIRLYQREAEGAIAQRGRPCYQAAAEYLCKARNLAEGVGEGTAFREYMSKLQEDNRTLRALREELDFAGL